MTKFGDDALRARIKMGTYTGDGSTSLAITGVGFQPKYVVVWTHETTEASLARYELHDQAATGLAMKHTSTYTTLDNRINSLDSDGFTVDDDGNDEHPNKNGQVYDYMAFG